MGTDIHLEVEVLGEDGLWRWIEHPDRPCDDEFCTDGKYNEMTPNKNMVGEDHYRCGGKGHYVDQFWNDRSYNTFAILADVRNGYGFAGIDTGDGFAPISQPRGLPADLSPECRRGDWNSDAHYEEEEDAPFDWDSYKLKPNLGEHSQSWLTVAELLAYDWEGQTTKHRGWVTPTGFEEWRRDGKPSSWSGGVSGGGIAHVSNAEMARMIDAGEVEVDPNERIGIGSQYYTQVEWEESYAESARGFLRVLHRDIVPLGDPDRVRIVFGFDS